MHHFFRYAARWSVCGVMAVLLQGYAVAQDRFNAAPGGPNLAPAPAPAQTSRAAPAGPGTETQDQGVPPPKGLHTGPMHGATPASVPGGRLVTTAQLVQALRGPASGRPLVFDVLGGPERLPGAQNAVPAHQAGSFDDHTQREFGRYLQQVTQGRMDVPLVFYCASTQCWMSYNAAVRAIAMGHQQVLWYRGGLEAWKQAGQPVETARPGPQPGSPPLPGGPPGGPGAPGGRG